MLADVFEKLTGACLEYYGLDSCHYFSSPVLTWDAVLKNNEIELELISENNLCLFVEREMRGSISYFAKQYRKAYNKFIKS